MAKAHVLQQVHIILPPLSSLLHTATQMGKISNTIHLSANRNGQLSLRVESDTANVQTDWRGLTNPDLDAANTQPDSQSDEMKFESVALEQKSFVKFLSSHVIANTTVASICADFACVFYVYIGAGPAGGGVLTLALLTRPLVKADCLEQLLCTQRNPMRAGARDVQHSSLRPDLCPALARPTIKYQLCLQLYHMLCE